MAATKPGHIRQAIPLLIVICCIGIRVQAQYGGGTGEPNAPYLIYTPEQMNAIGADPNSWDKHFKLMADIDLAAYAETGFAVIGRPLGRRIGSAGPGGFRGVFDGDNHAISHFVWPATARGAAALFERVGGPTGEIRNLTLIDPDMVLSEGSYGAPLVVSLDKGTLTNCHVRGGSISGMDSVGGLVEHNEGGRIVDCSVLIRVEGNRWVGGLVGYNRGTITGCHATGSVIGLSQVGGLVGYNRGTIAECIADCNVTGAMAGGLAGLNEATVADSHAVGDVNGLDAVGGLVGYHRIGTMKDCYSTGNIHGRRNVGGLVGEGHGNIIGCHATGNVTGERAVGGLAGDSWGTIDECYAGGDVVGDDYIGGLVGGGGYQVLNSYATGSVTGKRDVGGLIGGTSGLIENCYATGPVRGVEDIGGLVGGITGRLVNCFARGGVTGDNRIGGLAGVNGTLYSKSSITNCYATGSIHGPVEGNDVSQVAEDPCLPAMRIIPGRGPVPPGTHVGGLVGENYGSILNCYSSGAVLRTRGAGGLVGVNIAPGYVAGSFWDIEASGQTASAGGMGKTTAQMQTAVTFLGWGALDSQGAWTIDDGNDYPRLAWENRPGAFIDWPYPAGEGTKEAPYQIHTPEELILVGWFPSQWDKHFELMADIDLSMYEGMVLTIGNNSTSFTGVFEGHSHAISNFTCRTEDLYHAGLFGRVADPNAEIRNLGLIDANVSASKAVHTGSLVGHLAEGTVTDCIVMGGTVSGPQRLGGLIGESGDVTSRGYALGLIQNCYCVSTVRGEGSVGGMVGLNYAGAITGCFSGGDVIGTGNAGGLVGYNWRGTITNCRSTADVSGHRFVGGLVGRAMHGDIANSCAAGAVAGETSVTGLTGETSIGGLIGETGAPITHCYSSGAVSGIGDAGGLVGRKSDFHASVIASFWDVDTSGQATSAGGIGLETAAMKTASTFLDAGWDFVGETANGVEDVWWIAEGKDYPRLFWELP